MVMLTDQTTTSTGRRFYQILIVPEPLQSR
jgi:hypothetical protein